MFKKMLLLASMALAVVAVAAPASALAGWTQEGNPLEGEAHVTFAGVASFEAPAAEAGAEAELTATGFLEEGSTGRITSVSAHNCVGKGKLANRFCTSTFEATTPENVWAPVSNSDPWIFHCDGGVMTITHIRITNHYYADSAHAIPLGITTVLTGDIVVTPHEPEAISTVTVSSENAEVAGAGPAIVEGELATTPSGKYGCE